VVKRPRAPRWLSRIVIDAIHADQLREHGGLPGIRDEPAHESALARPQHTWLYADERDLATLAAAYGFALVRSHPYRDGNKRMGFLAMAIFLGINRHEISATDADVVTVMLALATGHVSEADLADWIRKHMTKLK
jgi:death on curing protein